MPQLEWMYRTRDVAKGEEAGVRGIDTLTSTPRRAKMARRGSKEIGSERPIQPGESVMSIAETQAPPTRMTTEEMLALPENGMDRELIRGELRETPVTKRNFDHSSVLSEIAFLLKAWCKPLPKPRGRVVSGEAGIRLRHDPDTSVGVDVAYVSPEGVAGIPKGFPFGDGPPVLVVEILSPSDTNRAISEKIKLYQECDVPIIWIVNPDVLTVTVYRRNALPALYNMNDVLSCEPEMPGFRLPVAEIFDFE